jgi:hypothetical protein
VKTSAKVELFYDGQWNDETAYAFTRNPIPIGRGRADESRHVEPSHAAITLDNRTGRFTPRNAASPLHGKIGRNTPVRVSNGASVRFTGEIPAWPPSWNHKGNDAWISVQAAGVMRRLGQGASPLRSAARRGTEASGPVAYWPLDDGKDSKSAAPVIGTAPMTPNLSSPMPGFAASSGVRWLEPMPTFDGSLKGRVAMSDAATEWGIGAIVLPAEGSAGPDLAAQYDEPAAGADYMLMGLFQLSAGTETIRSYWTFVPDTGSSTGDDFDWSAPGLLDGQPHYLELHVFQNGANIEHEVFMDGEALSLSAGTGVITGRTLRGVDNGYVGGVDDTACGHFAVWDDLDAMAGVAAAALGHRGEPAGERIERLSAEQGVTFTSTGDLADTAAMGPQPIDTFLDLLRECAAADGGILYEPRDSLALAYRTRMDLYNQAAALELDYTAALFGSAPAPVPDDLLIRNDVTIKRPDGSAARAVLSTGPLSTAAPPDGVGVYDTQLELNVVGDGFLANQAAWALALGTVDADRFPALHLNLGGIGFTGDAALTAAAAALELGDLVTIDNLPAFLPPDQARVMVQGVVEVLGNNTWDITINTSPYNPYEVAEYAAAEGGAYRYDTAGSSLAVEFDAGTDTSMSVAVDVLPLWTTEAGEVPFDIEAGGVRLTVTAISGASSPQTFTITQAPVNGVEKTIPAGTPVSLWTKARYAL